MIRGACLTGRDSSELESRSTIRSSEASPSTYRRWQLRFVLGLLLLIIGFGAFAVELQVWAEYQFRRAKIESDRLQFVRARHHIENCLKIWPRSFRVNFLAARLSRRLGDLDRAEKYLQICQDIIGHHDEVFLERLMIRAQSGDLDDVQLALRDFVEKRHPDSPLILEALARGYAYQFRFVDLDFVLHTWLELDPDNLLAHFFQAWAHEQLGARDDAVREYRAVVERDPENDEARLRLANLLIEKSLPAEAVEHLRSVISRHPENFAAKVRLALSLHDLGEIEQAKSMLDDVLRDEPDYAPALTARGRIALQLNQIDVAEMYLRRSAQIDRSDYATIYLLHQALERQEKAADLAEVTNRLKTLEADTRRLHELVVVRNSQRPNDPALHVEVGAILLRSGEKEEGLRWLQQALRIDPLYPRAHAELARYFELNGDAKRATHHRRLAGEFAPR